MQILKMEFRRLFLKYKIGKHNYFFADLYRRNWKKKSWRNQWTLLKFYNLQNITMIDGYKFQKQEMSEVISIFLEI